jgi:hypothetical protein
MSDFVFDILLATLVVLGLAAIVGSRVFLDHILYELIGRLPYRPRLASSLLVLAAALRGVLRAWIIYLVAFIVRDVEMARSVEHFLLVLGSVGAMFPIAVAMRACHVSQNAPGQLDLSANDPVVLLLRRFSSDGIFPDLTGFFYGIHRLSVEEELADLLADSNLGRFVALAQPDEPAQELGAQRIVAGRDWKSMVSNLLSRASVVILRLDEVKRLYKSDSLLWELNALVQFSKVDRTLFMLPVATSEAELWSKWDNVREVAHHLGYPRFPTTPPSHARFFHFGRHGAEFLCGREKEARSLRSMLTPFFTKLGAPLPPMRFKADAIIGKSLMACVFCYIVTVLSMGIKMPAWW